MRNHPVPQLSHLSEKVIESGARHDDMVGKVISHVPFSRERSGDGIRSIIGFVGNEAVAVFRIRVGRQINSAALVADGYHARTDGLTSLAVVFGAAGVWLGYPLADPVVGLLITAAIFGIVWQSARSVLTRMLDRVEPYRR